MADYGVQPTGFVRKPISIIQAEIEASLITEFGPGVIQTAQSPLGQLNGLFAMMVAQYWEQAEDAYQSYDPDQAEGVRLDTLARLRLLTRGTGETDQAFRGAITNAGRARIDLQDLAGAIGGIPGVTYYQIFVNDTNLTDANGMSPNTIAVAVTGGDEEIIGDTIRQYVVPGISTHGNTTIETNLDGFCRSLRVIRPIDVPVSLVVSVRTRTDKLGCPPPSPTAIRAALAENIDLTNGEDVTWFKVRSLIESLFPNVEVVSIVGERDGNTLSLNDPVEIFFVERASIAYEDVTITVL